MSEYLHLAIRFLDDRYHGSEWPPSSARIFQALLAAAKTGAAVQHWTERHGAALKWLEQQLPPDIFARKHSDGQKYTLFVPNNSLSRDMLSTKTGKQVAPKILRDHIPGNSDVVYRWQVSDTHAAREHLIALDQMTSRLCTLGWGIDFAAATAGINSPPVPEELEQFTPSEEGTQLLRVPAEGFLADLDQSYQNFRSRITKEGINPYTRPTRFHEQRYQKPGSLEPRRSIAFELSHLQEDSFFAARWDQAQTVSAWLRHAAAAALRQEKLNESRINSFVLGHTEPEDLGNRLSFVPLPSVGHEHTDGGIRRVLIVAPQASANADLEMLSLLETKLPGWSLTDDQGHERCMLAPVSNPYKVFPVYTGASQIWESVTPVVLHGFNAARRRMSLTKTDRLLSQAFESAGFPPRSIQEITFKTAPYWQGCEAAIKIRRPKHLERWPLLHVRVKFTEALVGPVLAGIGRHYGIGIFAARYTLSPQCANPSSSATISATTNASGKSSKPCAARAITCNTPCLNAS